MKRLNYALGTVEFRGEDVTQQLLLAITILSAYSLVECRVSFPSPRGS